MARDHDSSPLSVEPGCPTHGDEHMRECTMCGAEFCRTCFPRSSVCPDCAEQEEDEDSELEDAEEGEEEEEDEKEEEQGDETPAPGELLDADDRY
jgi:hypothetical protein